MKSISFPRAGLTMCIPLLLTACGSPLKVFRLSPHGNAPGRYVNGQYFIRQEQDSVIAELAYGGRPGDNIAFNLTITNKGQKPVTIFPEQFFILLQDTLPRQAGTGNKHFLRDPEAELLAIDRRVDAENRSFGTSAAISGTTALLGFFVALATIAKKRTEAEIEKEKAERQAAWDRAEAEHERTLCELNREHQKWSGTALRRNTLYKEQTVSGSLTFPFLSGYKYLTVVVFIEGHPLVFGFDQQEIEVTLANPESADEDHAEDRGQIQHKGKQDHSCNGEVFMPPQLFVPPVKTPDDDPPFQIADGHQEQEKYGTVLCNMICQGDIQRAQYEAEERSDGADLKYIMIPVHAAVQHNTRDGIADQLDEQVCDGAQHHALDTDGQ